MTRFQITGTVVLNVTFDYESEKPTLTWEEASKIMDNTVIGTMDVFSSVRHVDGIYKYAPWEEYDGKNQV